MPALDHTIFRVDLRASPSHLESYKAIRLASLRTDPGAFSSNYEREAAFSEEIWRDRLDPAVKRTFVCSVLPLSGERNASGMDAGVPHERESGDEVDAGTSGEGVWIGTATVIGSAGTHSFLHQLREAGVGAHWQMYCLVAMWVHPAHRGRGVGAGLVRACLEWARTNVDDRFSSEHSSDSILEKVVVLLVHDKNVAGRALYSSVGFTDLEEVSAGQGERWMYVKV